jgi:hypothetical protein
LKDKVNSINPEAPYSNGRGPEKELFDKSMCFKLLRVAMHVFLRDHTIQVIVVEVELHQISEHSNLGWHMSGKMVISKTKVP